MTSSIGLSAGFAYVVVVLVLAGAIAYRRLSQLARLMIATFVFACAWLITAALDAIRAPDWMMGVGGVVVVLSIVAVFATLHLWTQADGNGEPHPGYGGDDGGGGLRHRQPDLPQPGGGGKDPSWWPEFERRLALYVAERERENQRPTAVPTELDPARHQSGATAHGVAPVGTRRPAGAGSS